MLTMLSYIPRHTHHYCLSKHGTRLAAPSVPLETLLLLTWRGRGPSNSTSPPYLDIHADYVKKILSRLRDAAWGILPTNWMHSLPYERCPTRLSLIRNIGLVVVTQTVADGESLCALTLRGKLDSPTTSSKYFWHSDRRRNLF